MEEQFVTYEIALKLKELGFDEDCSAVFYQGKFMNGHIEPHVWYLVNSISTNSDCNSLDIVTAPLWQQVIDWFREEYDLHISFEPVYKPQQFTNLMYCYAISTKKNYYGGMDDNLDNWLKLNDGGNMFHIENSYYTAREQAILKAIELCKKN